MAKKVWNREMQAKVIARAWKDENFRKQLINNPKKSLAAMGIDLPANIDVKVLCDDATHVHFAIPPSPSQVKQLSDAELQTLAAAGSTWGPNRPDCAVSIPGPCDSSAPACPDDD